MTASSEQNGHERHGTPGRGILLLHPSAQAGFLPFRPGRHVLGRNPTSSFPLEGKAVSWEHAELFCATSEVTIRDLGSTNGVVIDGTPVDLAPLFEGAVLRLGDFVGIVTRHLSPAATNDDLVREAAALGMYVGPVLRQCLEPVRIAGGAAAPTVIEGETGTGKQLTARLLHALCRRRSPFVALDCEGPSAASLGGTLFGNAERAGVLAEAQSGTIFLRNLGSMPKEVQVRLAGVLAEGNPNAPALVVGSQEPLSTAVGEGRLDPALYRCLDGIKVHLPPLRRRVAEIPALFRLLLEQLGSGRVPGRSTELVERLCLYDWPCNVREMVLLVKRVVALHGDELRLRTSHLPPRMLGTGEDTATAPGTRQDGLDPGRLLAALRDAGGNLGRAASRLGISRANADALIERLGPSPPRAA